MAMTIYNGSFENISNLYDTRITRRLSSLFNVTETIFSVEEESYKKDCETDAFTAISMLGIVKDELEDIIREMHFMSDILVQLQKQEQPIVRQDVPVSQAV